MSGHFAGKFNLLQKKCYCKVLESINTLGFTLKNKATYFYEQEFHNEKSYPT